MQITNVKQNTYNTTVLHVVEFKRKFPAAMNKDESKVYKQQYTMTNTIMHFGWWFHYKFRYIMKDIFNLFKKKIFQQMS